MKPVTKIPERFVETEVDQELVLMRLADGDFFSLEGTARSIWLAIDGQRDRERIIAAVADEFATQPDSVRADVTAFLDELGEAGLIVG